MTNNTQTSKSKKDQILEILTRINWVIVDCSNTPSLSISSPDDLNDETFFGLDDNGETYERKYDQIDRIYEY